MNNTLYDVWFSAMLINRTEVYNELLAKYQTSENAFVCFDAGDLKYFSENKKNEILKKDISVAEKIIARCNKENVAIISRDSEYYPELLLLIDTPPIVLYAKGNLDKLKEPKITVIGSRGCDKDGVHNAKRFSTTFSDVGLSVVAGFAPGIEYTVNKAAQAPIIILPCGINITYPATHFRLRNYIMENGGLFISEYPFGVKAYSENFKYRNRLLAGISDATVFIQCGLKSGTAHTFNWTAVYGRDAYVIPGSINNRFYEGSNGYIKEGGILITTPEDVLIDYFQRYPFLIDKSSEHSEKISDTQELDISCFDVADENEKIILKALSGKIMHIDEIIKETNISVRTASVCLTNLELLNIVEKCEGNRYKING